MHLTLAVRMLFVVGQVAAPVFASFGIGLALGGVPGPVQALLLAESSRAVSRGIRAMAGANLTFGLLLVASAVGLSRVALTGTPTRLLGLAGGLMLLWLGAEGIRTSVYVGKDGDVAATSMSPAVRGASVVILNPGGWLFLATVAASLFATARVVGGLPLAVAAALAMLGGLMVGDGCVVAFGGLGVRRLPLSVQVWIRRALSFLLALQGAWLIFISATAT